MLLILTGVAIVTLTGENGILTQAGKAKTETTEAESIERVQVEVAGSYGLDGIIDKDQLNKNLKNINGLTYNGNVLSDSNKIDDLPATVTLNGYDVVIKANGGVEKFPEIIAKIRANPQAYYGKKVTNYKDDGNTYRIFYIDTENYFGDGENTIYLKADFSNTNYNLNRYGLYDTTNTKVRTMNPLWAAERGTSESSWEINEKSAAYLCSPVTENNYATTTLLPWNGYYNLENANYVIGGPSVEMYVKSYNQAYKGITDSNIYTLGATYRATDSYGYIYTLNGAQSTLSNDDYWTGIDSIDYQNYESMYCGKNGSKGSYHWWLASPAWGDTECNVCYVNSINAGLDGKLCYSENVGVSPLISLKSSFIPEIV